MKKLVTEVVNRLVKRPRTGRIMLKLACAVARRTIRTVSKDAWINTMLAVYSDQG
jgi:hypothetical protein